MSEVPETRSNVSVPEDVLTVVMPVYNERHTIREILRRVRRQRVVKEVLIVDDRSTDGTRELLKSCLKNGVFEDEHAEVRLCCMPENAGKGTALRTGFRHATGKYTVVQDADLEYDPEEYEKLLQPLEEGKADVVYGSRFSGERHRVHSFWHTLGNKLLTLLSNTFTNLNLSDMETCYKVFRTELIQGIPLQKSRFGFEPEITAKLAKLRVRIYEVPISYHPRGYSEGKKIGFADALRAVRKILYCFFVDDLGGKSMDWRLIRILQGAGKYNRWLFEQLENHLGDHVLELGSGFGNYTRLMTDRDRIVLSDWDPLFLRELQRSHGAYRNVKVVEWNPEASDHPDNLDPPEAVLSVNDLQKHEDDLTVMQRVHDLLPADGTFTGIVAADPRLYGTVDVTMGYERRYTEEELRNRLEQAGFQVTTLRPLNLIGKIGWAINSKVLRRRTLFARQMRLFDLLMPLVRLEEKIPFQKGLSYLFTATKQES